VTIRVRKAVFPVAGLGTRFLPATKALAKEMLPIIDKPLIQYAVEEAVAAGIEHLVFVTGHTKKAIEDHFDRSAELEAALEAQGKNELLARVRAILPSHVTCLYIRQPAPLGLGHAVLCARSAIGDEPFAILLPDDLIDCDGPGCTEQMVRRFESTGHALVAVQSVPREETGRYGIVRLASPSEHGGPIRDIVEKPAPDRAPSTLGVVGRYVMSPGIFDALENTAAGSGGEIQLTDAIAALLGRESVSAFPFAGTRYDCGSKEGFLAANVGLALKRPELRAVLQRFSIVS
jgi:UTP--glucose-1-phosphate uridylyltransferase